MTTTNTAALSLNALLARLESSEHLSVTAHEFTECAPGTSWIALEAGDFSVVVNLWSDHCHVTASTHDHKMLYSKAATGNWEAPLASFLESLALAAVPA